MKRIANWLSALVVAATALVACGLPEGSSAPDFSGDWWNAPEGRSLAELRGSVVLVEFWRTW